MLKVLQSAFVVAVYTLFKRMLKLIAYAHNTITVAHKLPVYTWR